MKKTFTVVLFTVLFTSLLFNNYSYGQIWHYEHKNHSSVFPFGASEQTDEGNYLFFFGENLVEMSDYGEPMYFYNIPAINSFVNTSYIHKESDGYVLAGSDGNPFNNDFIIKKIGLKGNILWQVNLVRPNLSILPEKAVVCTKIDDNELFVAGIDSIYSINTIDGNVTWRKGLLSSGRHFGSTFYKDNEIITTTHLGEVFRLDDNGNFIDSIELNQPVNEVIANGANYVAVGDDLIFINKATKSTTTIPFGNEELFTIKADYDGGFIIGGMDSQNAILIKTDAVGVEQWRKTYGEGIVRGLEISNYGGYVLSIYGTSLDFNKFLKTDRNGNTDNSIQRLQRFKRTIDVSNIKTMFGGDGSMFWDDNDAYFRVPKDSATSSIYTARLWMGGYEMDANGNPANLKIAADTYSSTNQTDFSAGYNNDGGVASDLVNKVWKIKRSELRDFVNDIADGTLSRPMPHDILTWPAIGNPNFKGIIDTSFAVTEDLAPFIDVNNDGIYNAFDGDYPSIKGDEMLLWIFNDGKGIHTSTMGDPIKADIVGMAYGYDCSGNSSINNTIFLEYNIVNTSNIELDSFFVGMWTDPDLGCPTDDYFGTDTVSNSMYFYNDGAVDGSGGCGPFPSYTGLPPIQSINFLNQSLSSTTYFVDGSWGLSGTNAPTTALQFYNYLTGTWKDGTPYYNSNDGYQQSGATTKYAFNSNPSDGTGWSMCGANLPGANIRTVSSTGPYSFQSGARITVEMAYTFHENILLPCPNIGFMRLNINEVKAAYDSNTLDWIPNLGEDRTIDQNSSMTLSPNYSGGSYQWSDNSSSPTLTVNTPGIYSVTITDSNGCQKTDEVNIFGYTNTQSINNNTSIKAFPNPVKDVLTVNFKVDTIYQKLSLRLTNMLGQIVTVENVATSEGVISIPVNNLATGVYLISILSDNDVLKTEKIIVE